MLIAAGAVAVLFAAVYALTPGTGPERARSTDPAALHAAPSPRAVAAPPAPPAPSAEALAEVAALSSAPAPATSATPPTLKITVQTVPEDARVTVDGALLPPEGQLDGFIRDNAVHKVRAEAPGYRAKAEWVRFDANDVTVRLTLEKKPRKDLLAPDGAARAGGMVGGATPESSAAREGAPPNRPRTTPPPLDSADPWKK